MTQSTKYAPVSIAQLDKAKLGGRVDDKVLSHLGHVDHHQTRPLQKLDDEISIRNDVHRVFTQRVEAELFSQELSVDRVRISGECCTAEGKDGDPGDELGETVEIGVEGMGVREEQVRPSDGLSSLSYEGQLSGKVPLAASRTHLNMRVAWHESIYFFFSSVGHHEDQVLEVFLDLFDFLHLQTASQQ